MGRSPHIDGTEPRTRRAIALLLAAILVASSCGVTTGGEIETIALPNDVFDADIANNLSPCNDTASSSHPVWFFKEDVIVETRRCLPKPVFLRPVLNSLLQGPNPDEIADGVTSAVPVGTEVLGVGIDPTREGVVVLVDLNNAFYEEIVDELRIQATAQLVFTAFDLFSNTTGVVFQREGVEQILPNGVGEQANLVLTLEDFDVFLEPPTPAERLPPPPLGLLGEDS